MYMSIVSMLNIRLFWRNSLHNNMVADVMSRDRFLMIVSYFHLLDTSPAAYISYILDTHCVKQEGGFASVFTVGGTIYCRRHYPLKAVLSTVGSSLYCRWHYLL
jgi:hypothetical protein